MSVDPEQAQKAGRELAQLLRIQERLVNQLQDVRAELDAPTTLQILRDSRSRTSSESDEAFAEVTAAVEEAIRALKVFESEVKRDLLQEPDELAVDGIPDLPDRLARFLTERSQLPGFEYTVAQDPVRGWIIRWKEYTSAGTIRGYGQIFERPHAWLDE